MDNFNNWFSCEVVGLRTQLTSLEKLQNSRSCNQIRRAKTFLLEAQVTTDPAVARAKVDQAKVEIEWAQQWA